MSHTFEEVRQLAHELPTDERIMLANALWESVDAPEEGTEAEITATWDAEVKLRLDEIDSGAVELIPAGQVLAEMTARLSTEARARLRG